jgi:hypothetical protein
VLMDFRKKNLLLHTAVFNGVVPDSAFSPASQRNIQLCRIMKRKNDEKHAANGKAKKRALSEDDVKYSFRPDLFDTKILEKYKSDYVVSEPYVLQPCLISF